MNFFIRIARPILFSFIITGCNSISGTYVKNISPNYSAIIIDDNNKFKYSIHHDVLGDLIVDGFWKKSGDTIDLNFENVPKKIEKGMLEITYLNDVKSDSCFIQFFDKKNNPLLGRIAYINSEKKFINSIEGKIFFKPKQVEKVSLKDIEDDNILTLKIDKFLNFDSKIIVSPNKKRSPLYEMLPEKLILKNNKLFYFKNEQIDIKFPFLKKGHRPN